jgi:hypothetical protein
MAVPKVVSFGGMLGTYVIKHEKNAGQIKDCKMNAIDSFYLSMMSLST